MRLKLSQTSDFVIEKTLLRWTDPDGYTIVRFRCCRRPFVRRVQLLAKRRVMDKIGLRQSPPSDANTNYVTLGRDDNTY